MLKNIEKILKKFIKEADKGKNVKLISGNREWYINTALILAFEEVKGERKYL